MATSTRATATAPIDLSGTTYLSLYREGHTERLITHTVTVLYPTTTGGYRCRCECGYEYNLSRATLRLKIDASEGMVARSYGDTQADQK